MRSLALWKAFWPSGAVLAVYALVALSGLQIAMSAQLAAILALVFWTALIISLVHGFSRFTDPPERDAIRLLDRQSELRPLQALADRPVRPGGQGDALWHQHEENLTDAARRLSVPDFAADWRRSDPAHLRFIIPALVAALAVLVSASVPERLSRALDPDYGSLFGAESIRIEAWITPPAHTGRPPVFLASQTDAVRVPAGSVVTVRAQAPSAPRLRLSSADGRNSSRFEETPDGAFEATAQIVADTTVSVRWWGERASWPVLASPDSPPTVSFVSLPVLGDGDRTEFSWQVEDDYGVERLELAIRPVGEEAVEDRVLVDLGRAQPKSAENDAALDLTRQRWAGARVRVALVATDGAGQTGESESHEFILPEKLLLQPLARAIQDIRVTVLREDTPYAPIEASVEESLTQGAVNAAATRRVEAAPPRIRRAGLMLEAVTYAGDAYYEDIMMFTGLRSAHRTLLASDELDDVKATEPLLWALALRAEYGSAADALAALLAAREALEEALRDGASEEEIRRRMEAFKDAAQRYIAARMAEAMARGLPEAPDNTDSAMQGMPGQSLGGQDFADMLDALEDLTETGAADQARQLLADITNMLENLEFQQGNGSGQGFPGMAGEGGEDSEDQLPQEERELTETMQELLDLLREQRELNDETLAQQRGEAPQGEQGQSGQAPGQQASPEGEEGESGGQAGEGERGLAERQEELGDRVEELARRFGQGELGGEAGEGEGRGLDERALRAIERSQRRAGQALRDGNEFRALGNQEQATQQLRELAEGLADELDALRAERLGENPEVQEGGPGSPFGLSNNGGVDDSNSVDIPDEIERQRARDILDLLRQRYDETTDEEERDYLERLLDRF